MRTFIGYVICDLDGCLSDDRARRHLLPTSGNKRRDYDDYHAACGADPVNEGVLNDVMYALHDERGAQRSLLIIATGRNEFTRDVTEAWLTTVLGPEVEFVLLMRPDGNYQKAPALKVEALNAFFEGIHGNPASGWERVVSAYDDREDVLAAYPIRSDSRHVRAVDDPPPQPPGTPEILQEMATTFAERNAVYGDNYLRVAPIIRVLWPEGVPSELVVEDRWHLFELLVVKLTRFAIGNLAHVDSIHDAAVYAAMIESDLRRNA